MLHNSKPLPTVPMDQREGAWETIITIIVKELLPRLELVGPSLFHPTPQPLPEDACPVPFHDLWTRCHSYPEQFPQLAYVVAGQGEMILDSQWLSIPAGKGVFVPAGVPQTPHAMRKDRVRWADWLRVLVYPFGVIVHRCRITPVAHEKSVRYFVPDETLSSMFRAWMREGSQEKIKLLRDKSLLIAFFCLLAEANPVPINPMDWLPENMEALPAPLRQAILLLHSNLSQPFRLSTLATRCLISPYHLCYLFRRYLGTTPLGYLTRLRLLIARHLLEQVGLSIGDVAALVGYSDWRHFHRLFVRYFGAAPSTFRQKERRLIRRIFKPPLARSDTQPQNPPLPHP